MKATGYFLLMMLVLVPHVHGLYGRRPIEAILRDDRVTVVDATVEELTTQGFAKIETHAILKGTTSPAMLKGFFMSASTTVRDVVKKEKRYIFVIKSEEIYEPCTFWEVLRSFDGELMCYYYRYKPAPGLRDDSLSVLAESGLHKLSDFKKWIRRVIEKELVSSNK